jgi:hypothetical protein
MPSQAYYDGDWWVAKAATLPGQSPDTNPELWQRVEIPEYFEQLVVGLAHASLLLADGQTDKAAGVRAAAINDLLPNLVLEEPSDATDPSRDRPTVYAR